MPASRSARAMILAPRSCPSRPGFATTTRILRSAMAASLWRAIREGSGTDERAVAGAGALADARPNEPAIRAARSQSQVVAAEVPCAMEPEAGPPRPHAQQLEVAAEQLDVVVAGTAHRGPAQGRRVGHARAGGRPEQPRTGDRGQRARGG